MKNLYFRKELPSSKNRNKTLWRNLLYFLKTTFDIFRETEFFLYFLKKNFLIFWKAELSNNNNKTFQEETFRAQKVKKATLKNCLIFRGRELSSHKKLSKNKTFLYSQQNSLRRNRMLEQYLLFTGCSIIQFFSFIPLPQTESVRAPLVPYHSLCSTCVTYGTPCPTISHQVLPI